MSGKQPRPTPPAVTPDCSLDRLERSWLSAHNEAAALKSECQLLEQVFRVVQADWREAQDRLAQSEALRDALGAQCMTLLDTDDGMPQIVPLPLSQRVVA